MRLPRCGPAVWCLVALSVFDCLPAGAQNSIIAEPQEQTLAGNIGQGSVLGSFQLIGAAPNSGNTTVKLKLSSISGNSDNLLLVSPSSGTTPASVLLSLNPSVIGTEEPGGTRSFGLNFETTDQNPPSISGNTLIVTIGTVFHPAVQSVRDAASAQPLITPGGIVSILGTNLAPAGYSAYSSSGLFPTTLASTMVTFDGVAAPLLSRGPGQILARLSHLIRCESRASGSLLESRKGDYPRSA